MLYSRFHFLFFALSLILAFSCHPDPPCEEGYVVPSSSDTSPPQVEWWVTDFVMTPSGPISSLTIYGDGEEVHVSPESEVSVQLVARDEESGITVVSLQGGFSWSCMQSAGSLLIVDGIIPEQTQHFNVSSCACVPVEGETTVELIQPDCGTNVFNGAGYGLSGSATNGAGLTTTAELTVIVDP